MDLGHWQWDKEEFNPDDYEGFIYIITNKVSGRKYIGRKKFRFLKTRQPLKGKKNKRREYIESDWKTYTGSSNTLNKDIEKIGIENFSFDIIELCTTPAWMCYNETKHIILHEAILRDDYYNHNASKIPCRPK